MATFNVFRNDSLLNNRRFREPNADTSLRKICLRNGYVTCSLLIATFLALCAITHRLEINQLSAVHLFILAFGVYYALEDLSPDGKGASLDYFEGFKAGLYSSCVAVGVYALFIGIYASFDASILNRIDDNTFWKSSTDPLMAAGILLFEGLASGVVITFCLMQHFKRN